MRKLNKIYSLMRADKFASAIKELEKLEDEPLLYPKILILKAECIFLSDEDDGYSYSDVTKTYKKALSIDNEYPETLLDLGSHYYASENKTMEAIPLFEKAIRILKSQIIDAVTGYAKCIEEIKSPKAAIKYLKDVKLNFLDVKEIDELIKEFSEME